MGSNSLPRGPRRSLPEARSAADGSSSTRLAGASSIEAGARRRWGRAPPRPARASSSGGAGDRPCLRRRKSPVVAIVGGRRRPGVLVPHVRGTRGVIPGATWSFQWPSHAGGNFVGKTSLRRQFRNLHSKSGKWRYCSSKDGKQLNIPAESEEEWRENLARSKKLWPTLSNTHLYGWVPAILNAGGLGSRYSGESLKR